MNPYKSPESEQSDESQWEHYHEFCCAVATFLAFVLLMAFIGSAIFFASERLAVLALLCVVAAFISTYVMWREYHFHARESLQARINKFLAERPKERPNPNGTNYFS